MAIIMSKNNSWAILGSILGDTQPYQKAKYLQSLGAEIKVGLFALTVTVNGKEFSETMPVSFSTFSQATVQVQTLVKAKIAALVDNAVAYAAVPVSGDTVVTEQGPVSVQPVPSTPGWMNNIPTPANEVKAAKSVAGPATPKPASPPAADNSFEAWQAKNTPVTPVTPAKPKPVPDVIPLKDARALSQKVRGTSGGSVYRVAAVGKVNIAIREQVGTVSVRAEFQGKADPKSVDKLIGLGFSEGKNYLSMHISLTSGAPAMRVVGSILLGAGLEFEQIATTLEQVNAI